MSELKSANARLEYKLSRSNDRERLSCFPSPVDSDHCYAASTETEDRDSPDIEVSKLLEVTEQLQTMTRLYEKLKNSMRKLEAVSICIVCQSVESQKLPSDRNKSVLAHRKESRVISNFFLFYTD